MTCGFFPGFGGAFYCQHPPFWFPTSPILRIGPVCRHVFAVWRACGPCSVCALPFHPCLGQGTYPCATTVWLTIFSASVCRLTRKRNCSGRLHFAINPVWVHKTPHILHFGAASKCHCMCAVPGCLQTPQGASAARVVGVLDT